MLSADDTGVIETDGLMSLDDILVLPDDEFFDEALPEDDVGGLVFKALISKSFTTMLSLVAFLLGAPVGESTILGRISDVEPACAEPVLFT